MLGPDGATLASYVPHTHGSDAHENTLTMSGHAYSLVPVWPTSGRTAQAEASAAGPILRCCDSRHPPEHTACHM